MERAIPVTAFRRGLLVIAALGCLAAASMHQSLVLVARSDANFDRLSSVEIRKLFLGIPVLRNGIALQPIINRSDPLLHETFLQNVIFMSAQNYDRQLFSQVFRMGGAPPTTVQTLEALRSALEDSNSRVAVMWSDSISPDARIKTLSVLWSATPQ
jgi:hypothetical protein